MMFSCGWKERRFSLKTSHSCKGPAVRITKENQPKGNSMTGKKSKTKRGKYTLKLYIYIFLHYDAETSITKHLEEGRGYAYFPCVSKHQS